MKLLVGCLLVFCASVNGQEEGQGGVFVCDGGRTTIENEMICDSEYDCIDFSDESTITCGIQKCNDVQWRCKETNECIPSRYVCDGWPDCHDKTDELFCPDQQEKENSTYGLECPEETEFVCGDVTGCLTCDQMCDGVMHCEDRSDEFHENCHEICNKQPKTTTTTTTVSTTTTKLPAKKTLPKICKRNATKKICFPFLTQIAHSLPFKIFKKCQRKQTAKPCKRFKPVLDIMLTKEFQAAKCQADPKMCRKFKNGKNKKRKKRGGKGERKRRKAKV